MRILAVLSVVFAVSLGALADDQPTGGNGGEVPFPFQSANTRVELANGEFYTLLGTVEIVRDQAFIDVDLAQHPWLANQKRRQSSRYRITNFLSTNWQRYSQHRVQIFVKAHEELRITWNGELPVPEAEITLESMKDPVDLAGTAR